MGNHTLDLEDLALTSEIYDMERNPNLQARPLTPGLLGNLVVTGHCAVLLERIVGYQVFPPVFFQLLAKWCMYLFSHKLPAMEGVLLKKTETVGQLTTC